MTPRRRFPLALLVAAAAVGSARSAVGGDAPAPAAPAAPAPKAAKRPMDPKERDKLIPLLRVYLDPENPKVFAARNDTVALLRSMKDSGCDVLADREAMLSVLYAARGYEPAFEKKLVAREDKVSYVDFDTAANLLNVKLEGTRLSISLPAGYEEARKGKKLPTLPPYPGIVTLHELEDFQAEGAAAAKRDPGAEVIKRRWPRKGSKIPDGWFVYAPVVTRAAFMKDGVIDPLTVPLRELYARYHLDVDRLVLEGGSDAVALAAAQPTFFAGLIVRNADKATVPPELVGNLSSLWIYAVGGAASPFVKALEAGGHPGDRLTVGNADGLADWLQNKDLKRTTPTKFRWTVKDPNLHGSAHWVNIEQVDNGSAKPPVLDVNVDKAANAIQVTSTGVRGLSFFLSDDVVDLGREVRIVLNGQPVKEIRIQSPKDPEGERVKLPASFETRRTLDNVLDLLPINPRRGLYVGWLVPVVVMKVPVKTDRDPAAEVCPTTDAAEAARVEREAQVAFEKAAEAEAAGDVAKAVKLYRKAVEAGASTFKEKAEAKLKALEPKAGGGGAATR